MRLLGRFFRLRGVGKRLFVLDGLVFGSRPIVCSAESLVVRGLLWESGVFLFFVLVLAARVSWAFLVMLIGM